MRKNKFAIFSIIILGVAFAFGYLGADIYFNPEDILIEDLNQESMDVSLSTDKEKVLNRKIDSVDEITFTVQCGNSDIFRVERKTSPEELDLTGILVKDLFEKYKEQGYKIRSVSNNRIELCRKSITYKPNKYIILLENNNVLICKSNEKGQIYDENGEYILKEELGDTGINITINSLQEGDIKLMITGDDAMQLDTLDDVFSRLADYI